MSKQQAITSRFQIGDKVTAIGFTDCFGKVVHPTPGLTVSEIRKIECASMAVYYRIKADGPGGFNYIEGAERFFSKDLDISA